MIKIEYLITFIIKKKSGYFGTQTKRGATLTQRPKKLNWTRELNLNSSEIPYRKKERNTTIKKATALYGLRVI